MGCNCKVNEQILKLHKDYGVKNNVEWYEKVEHFVIEGFKLLLATVIMLLFLPIIILYILILRVRGVTNINIDKVTRLFLKNRKNE